MREDLSRKINREKNNTKYVLEKIVTFVSFSLNWLRMGLIICNSEHFRKMKYNFLIDLIINTNK
jgi:predicted site-specific integrase-resolvase